jgi:hypothetical protein
MTVALSGDTGGPAEPNVGRFVRVASLSHRVWIWRRVRSEDRWPTRSEWRFIVLGRWSEF